MNKLVIIGLIAATILFTGCDRDHKKNKIKTPPPKKEDVNKVPDVAKTIYMLSGALIICFGAAYIANRKLVKEIGKN